MAQVNMTAVAQRAGVSTAAVSVALSGRIGRIKVSEATRERILAAAAELGYSANPLGRSLVMQKSFLVALLGRESFFVFALETIKGIESVLREMDYSLLVYYDGSWAADQARHLKLATERRSDGLILVGAPESAEGTNHQRVEALRQSGLPLVQLYRPMYPDIPTVMVDHEAVGYQQVKQLLKSGHKRIVHVTHDSYLDDELPGTHADALQGWQGYQRAMLDAGLEPRVLTYPIGYPHDFGYIRRASAPLIPALRDFTAAACYCDFNAIAISGLLQEAGLRVPQDFSLIGYNDAELAAAVSPGISTFALPLQEMGAAAARLLFGQMQGETRVGDLVLPPRFVSRDSIAKPTRRHS